MDNVEENLLSSHDYWLNIHCEIVHTFTNRSFALTAIYGSNNEEERLTLWQFLITKANTALPWLTVGDFNHLLHTDDRIGGTCDTPGYERLSRLFPTVGIQDIAWKSCRYTWTNKQDCGQRIFLRNDGIMANGQWLAELPKSKVIFHPDDTSYHYPRVLRFFEMQEQGRKTFRFFFDMWTTNL